MKEILKMIGVTLAIMTILTMGDLGMKEGFVLLILFTILMEYVWNNTPEDEMD